jgi:hypothetical protein
MGYQRKNMIIMTLSCKTSLAYFLACLLTATGSVGAANDTSAAESPSFALETRDAANTTEAFCQNFTLDVRNRGNSDSMGSGTFLLNTLGTAPTDLEIVGPASVVAGSQTDYRVIWHAGFSDLDVTSDARWRFLTSAPGNTGMVTSTFYAGETNAPATVQIVASYLAATGQSKESPAFGITITQHLKAVVAITQTGTGKFTLTAAPSNNHGASTVSWDLNGDGTYGDAYGETALVDYGSWTGSTKVKALVTDGDGNTHIETRDVVVNKLSVVNQPVTIPAIDPVQGFFIDKDHASFAFRQDRKDNGLVVITHGIYTDTSLEPGQVSNWEMDMASKIEARTSAQVPNIAILDWGVFSKNPVDVDWLTKSAVSRWAVWALRKAYGTPVDVVDKTIQTEDFLADLYAVRENGACMGQVLAGWVFENIMGSKPGIDTTRPIHFIGHSAGGFVMGECARSLKYIQNVTVDRVTMLDTPFPYPNHLGAGNSPYPNPGVAERIVSSNFGVLQMPFQIYPAFGAYYQCKFLDSLYGVASSWNTGETGHGYSYVWYSGTIADSYSTEGFANSPILTGIKASPSMRPRSPAPPLDSPDLLPDFIPTGWQTFGSAVDDNGTWTLTEAADAGIWTDMAMPVAAQNLAFEFQFTKAGDGDFLAVHFGDMPVLYRGIDQVLSRDGWISGEIPLDLIGATNGKLVFTLVSRGNPNAQVQIRNIRIAQSNDVDGDGLTNEQEAAIGTDPRNPDTDGGDLSDGDEVNTYHTDPLLADTDGDGQSDASELAVGTDPLSNGSFFRVTDIHKEATGGMTLNWPGAVGKTYRVRRSQELGTDNYEIIGQGIPAVQPLTSFTDTAPPAGRGFYWVEVE